MGQMCCLMQGEHMEAGVSEKNLSQLCVEYPDATEMVRTSHDGLSGRFLRTARDADSMRLEMPDVPIGTTIQIPNGPCRMIIDNDTRQQIATQELEAQMTNRRILHLHNNRERLRKFDSVKTDIEFTQAMQIALRTFTGTLYVLEKYGPAITIEGTLKANGASWENHLQWLGRKDEDGSPLEPGQAHGRFDHYRVAFQAACYWADHHERTIYALAGPLKQDIPVFSSYDYDEMMSAFVTFTIAIIGKVYAGKQIDVTAIRKNYAEGISDEIQQSIDDHITRFVEHKYKGVAYHRRPMIPRLTRAASRETYLGTGTRHRAPYPRRVGKERTPKGVTSDTAAASSSTGSGVRVGHHRKAGMIHHVQETNPVGNLRQKTGGRVVYDFAEHHRLRKKRRRPPAHLRPRCKSPHVEALRKDETAVPSFKFPRYFYKQPVSDDLMELLRNDKNQAELARRYHGSSNKHSSLSSYRSGQSGLTVEVARRFALCPLAKRREIERGVCPRSSTDPMGDHDNKGVTTLARKTTSLVSEKGVDLPLQDVVVDTLDVDGLTRVMTCKVRRRFKYLLSLFESTTAEATYRAKFTLSDADTKQLADNGIIERINHADIKGFA
ncbi:unnamed protein product [Trypanosoma congolense IL3000]|uniref:WGS project CAEQ00000000 data, annotated contig 828 n=1 Tax=Trypanosoma congolense (strain IL3000) TaxID=1068625 RepID=F9WIS9_TRYCI|nr:unnamed protein product [Trypanosoma congolense IL3000]